MPAYATHGAQLGALPPNSDLQHRVVGEGDRILEGLIAQLADRVTAAVLARVDVHVASDAEWLDSRHAADYLGLHRDTLRKLAAERAISSEQDGPGCSSIFGGRISMLGVAEVGARVISPRLPSAPHRRSNER